MHALALLVILLVPTAPPCPADGCAAWAWAAYLDRPGLDCATLYAAGRAGDRAHGHATAYGLWGLSSVGDVLVASHLLAGVTYTQSPALARTWVGRQGIVIAVQAPGQAGHALYCPRSTATTVRCVSWWGGAVTTATYPPDQWARLPDFWAARPVR